MFTRSAEASHAVYSTLPSCQATLPSFQANLPSFQAAFLPFKQIFLPPNQFCEQGEPSDSASLRGARAAEARALVFLGAAQRPMMVTALLCRTCLVTLYMKCELRHITSNVLNECIMCGLLLHMQALNTDTPCTD